MEPEFDSFAHDGFAGPFPLFTEEQCALVLRHFRYGEAPAPLKWERVRQSRIGYREFGARRQIPFGLDWN